MDCRLQARVKAMAEELAREYQQELADAGTLVDLEDLTCEIGDEVTRLLTERELARCGQHDVNQPAECPACGQDCLPMLDPDPVVLAGLRGAPGLRTTSPLLRPLSAVFFSLWPLAWACLRAAPSRPRCSRKRCGLEPITTAIS